MTIKIKQKTFDLFAPNISYLINYLKILYFLIFVRPQKNISAVFRIKNEEEYLYSSVKAIIDYVDEVILVDNQSTDTSPDIIKKLKSEYPNKIISYVYPYQVAKVGKDSNNLALKNKYSPSHITNFTNWCIKKSTKPYILLWAPDHLATKELKISIKEFKKSPKQLFFSRGLNIFPDLKHTVKTITNKTEFEGDLFGGALDSYLTKYTFDEYRIFPKKFSNYSLDYPYLEYFKNPFLTFRKFIYLDKRISFLHLKFCKKEPYQILSSDVKNTIIKNLKSGNKLDKKYQELLSRYNIQLQRAQSENKSKLISQKRPLVITIDGDGFFWKNTEGKFASEIFYEEIIKKYPFQFTASIITQNLSQSDKQSENLVKKIFLSKNIEIASHSFSHPRNWRVSNIDLNHEIDDSVDYLNNFFVKNNKKVKTFLWTGQCNPNEEALMRVSNLNLSNLNGNEINYPYIQIGNFKHYMSRSYPDWHYMNLKRIWVKEDSSSKLISYKGKLDGYKNIINYFENYPARPVHLWLHWYSALRKDSLGAIKEVLDWCLENDLESVYASEYIKNIGKMF